eukprot:3875398-Pyramimonas_sp.AAC.1
MYVRTDCRTDGWADDRHFMAFLCFFMLAIVDSEQCVVALQWPQFAVGTRVSVKRVELIPRFLASARSPGLT